MFDIRFSKILSSLILFIFKKVTHKLCRYENDHGEQAIPWQTSWGLTTRTIGVTVMVHGDNKGLVLPPRIAPVQVVICPITMKDTDTADLLRYCDELKRSLVAVGIRVELDSRQVLPR
jgi:prolyl-tRNA synthetase